MTPGRYNAIMLAVVLVLGAWLALRPDPRAPAPSPPLLAHEPAAVDRIRIERPGRPAVELERGAAGWRLLGAHAGPAAAGRAEALARFPASPAQPVARPDEGLQRYGLDPPRAVLALGGLRFLLGESHPFDGRRYVLHAGKVHLVEEAVSHHLLASPAAFADPRLVPRPEALVGITLPQARLERAAGAWRLAGGGDATALASAWLAAKALAVRPLEGGAAPEAGGVTLRYRDGRERRLGIRRREAALVLTEPARGLQYELDGEQGQALLPPAPAG